MCCVLQALQQLPCGICLTDSSCHTMAGCADGMSAHFCCFRGPACLLWRGAGYVSGRYGESVLTKVYLENMTNSLRYLQQVRLTRSGQAAE